MPIARLSSTQARWFGAADARRAELQLVLVHLGVGDELAADCRPGNRCGRRAAGICRSASATGAKSFTAIIKRLFIQPQVLRIRPDIAEDELIAVGRRLGHAARRPACRRRRRRSRPPRSGRGLMPKPRPRCVPITSLDPPAREGNHQGDRVGSASPAPPRARETQRRQACRRGSPKPGTDRPCRALIACGPPGFAPRSVATAH